VPDHHARRRARRLQYRGEVGELQFEAGGGGLARAVPGAVVGDHPVVGCERGEDRRPGGRRRRGAGLEDDRRIAGSRREPAQQAGAPRQCAAFDRDACQECVEGDERRVRVRQLRPLRGWLDSRCRAGSADRQ
jgi:hypothetical protein